MNSWSGSPYGLLLTGARCSETRWWMWEPPGDPKSTGECVQLAKEAIRRPKRSEDLDCAEILSWVLQTMKYTQSSWKQKNLTLTVEDEFSTINNVINKES